MVLVIAWPDLALRVCKVVEGARYITHVTDGIDLRHRVHEHQPDVIVLDWRMGGSLWRAIDEVPAIVSRTSTHPYVIAVLPSTSGVIERQAGRGECYDVVDLSASCFERELAEAVGTATRARTARPHLRYRVEKSDLH